MDFKTQISTEKAPKAIGPYSQGICVDALVCTSGQLPVNVETGKIVDGGIVEQTTQSLKNVEAVLEAADLTLGNVIKTTVFLSDMNDFVEMNKVYSSFFKEIYPARSCVQVAALPMGAKVEIEVLCVRGTISTKPDCGCNL